MPCLIVFLPHPHSLANSWRTLFNTICTKLLSPVFFILFINKPTRHNKNGVWVYFTYNND